MNRKLLASAICASLFVAGSAYAQNTASPAPQPQAQPQQPAQPADQTKTLETITVSGSLLKRPEYQTVVPVQVINIQNDLNTGAFGTVDLLQSTAVALGSTQINNQFSGFVVGGGTGIQTINLRGLGSQRTLVLLDGQRPGPAGTQGQTGIGFDLNVVPDVILQRIEIVKDGSSSIYGSDAIAGVVNLITKKRIDGTQMNAFYGMTQHGGGDQYNFSIAHGFNFAKGNVLLAAQFSQQQPLRFGDRDFLNCSNDRVWGADGRIDRADHSITQGTSLSGCNNLYANTIIKYFDSTVRYIPSPDGSTVGPFPGYRPRPYPTPQYNDPNNPQGAYYEDVLNFAFLGPNAWVINKNRNESFYASSQYNFDNGITWNNQFLYNYRQTRTQDFRQFFPIVLNPTDSDYYEPVMPYPMNQGVNVSWWYYRTSFDGGFGDSSWSWQANATYTRNSGTYFHNGIDTRRSGDLQYYPDTAFPPLVDYFDPCILSGECMGQLVDAVGQEFRGHTKYTQTDLNYVATGNLFSLPAGEVSMAVGAEYRRFAIDDQPDPDNSAGYEWGFSSAQVTKGSDYVTEAFTEIGIPLLAGKPWAESLTADVSARIFRYSSVGTWDNVWKYGLNWQITPTWRMRGTMGTSYRAPQLYELYLGNQSGFLGQLGIDPCILWGDSTNDFIRANCGAAGIPPNYGGAGPSAEVFQGGGKGFLAPETSRAKTIGIVWTPTFANFNLALDYFDYKISGEITTLGASDILFGCYGSAVYPNDFCKMFTRNPPNAPADANSITQVFATFVNINKQRQRGYDLQMNYSQDFSFGTISADAQITYTIEDVTQLFDSAAASGQSTSNRIGYIGSPQWVGVFGATYQRGDWSFNWQGRYFSTTGNLDLSDRFTYYSYPNAYRDVNADAQFINDASVRYGHGDKWGVTFGIRNLFDSKPDEISTGVDTRYGNIPAFASQYDWYGRTFFVRANYSF